MQKLAITMVFLAAAAVPAAAEPVVLSVERGLVYVDLGSRDGVGDGTELELVREVVARDPVSGQVLRDKFALGTLVVTKAGDRVCAARPSEAMAGRVRAGDEIRLSSEKRTFIDPWAQRVLASQQPADRPGPAVAIGPGADRAGATRAVEEAVAAQAVWAATLGKDPAARAGAWRSFLAARPTTPYAAAIRAELASLEAQALALERAEAAARTPTVVVDRRRALADALAALVGEASGALWASAPTRVGPGQPVTLAFTQRGRIEGAAWLYVRPGGTEAFQRIALVPEGDGYLRATIPAAMVTGDRVDWFVEVGESSPGIGSRAEPRTIVVDREVGEAPPATGRSQIALRIDYVDFDGGFEKGFDQYRQFEAEFAYRFLQPVHTVRLGFGSLSGKGGPKDVIDLDKEMCIDAGGAHRCRSVEFTYVFTEIELRPRKMIAVMLRPQAGLLTTNRVRERVEASDCRDTSDIENCEFFAGFGFRGRVRFGEEDSTNLELSAAFTDRVGTLFEAAYNWAPRYEFPIHLAVQVTDLPVPEDLGVRLITEVGWREWSRVYPSLRLSYQARDIDHLGVSGGVGLNFDW